MKHWRHIFLLSSLPRMPALAVARVLPIGQATLRQRLAVLDAADQALLGAAESLLQWPQGWNEETDRSLLARLQRAAEHFPCLPLREHCAARLQLLSLLGALRARRAGAVTAPDWLSAGGAIGAQVARRWNEPLFGLAAGRPWLVQAASQHAAQDWEALERGLIAREYAALGMLEAESGYALAAVIARVLRWQLLARWLGFDAARATERFGALLASALRQAEVAGGR